MEGFCIIESVTVLCKIYRCYLGLNQPWLGEAVLLENCLMMKTLHVQNGLPFPRWRPSHSNVMSKQLFQILSQLCVVKQFEDVVGKKKARLFIEWLMSMSHSRLKTPFRRHSKKRLIAPLHCDIMFQEVSKNWHLLSELESEGTSHGWCLNQNRSTWFQGATIPQQPTREDHCP